MPDDSVDPARLKPKTVEVGFRDSIHVRGLERGALMRAVVERLRGSAIGPASSGERDRDMFFVSSGKWQSFGETIHAQPFSLFRPRFVWAPFLSRALNAPVLMVRTHATWIELATFEEGLRRPIVVARPGTTVDLAPLATIAPIVARKPPLLLPRRATGIAIAKAVGEHLGLPAPVLEGSLRGLVVPFSLMKSARV